MDIKRKDLRVSTHLPLTARRILVAAAKFTGPELEKEKALDEAIRRVRRMYPDYFR